MPDLKYMACSDIQFPLHDQRAVDLWLKAVKSFKPDVVDLIGDLDNADPTGRWAAGSNDELLYGLDLKTESREVILERVISGIAGGGAEDTKKFIQKIRKTVPSASIMLYDGNHGWTRHESYLKSKAPWILDENLVNPNSLYGLDEYGVEFHRYDALPHNRFHDMYIHHGQAVSKHSGESVKADVDSWGVSLIRGHSHRLGNFYKTYELTGQDVEAYELGHLMDVKKATYMNQRNWQQGFIYGYITDVDYHLSLVKIKNYTAYVAGKKIQA